VQGPAATGGHALVGEELGAADDLGELLHLVFTADLHHEPAVVGTERVADEVLLFAEAVDAERTQARDDVGHRDHRVVHGDVDVLTLAGLVAVAQRGEDADRREQRGADVAERADGVGARRLVGACEHVVVDARHRLGDGRVRGPAVVRRAAVAEARHRHVDEARVHGGYDVVAEAHAVERATLEVLREHVELLREVEDDLLPRVGLQVDGDRPLVEVVAQERGAHELAVGRGHPGLRAATGLAAERLDLHDVGAEAGEELGGVRQGLHLLQGEDAHPFEGLAVLQGICVDDISEFHGVEGIAGGGSGTHRI